MITPSGFKIGTILKIKCSLKALASAQLLVRNSKIPFIIQDELVSPGWILALKNTPFLDNAFKLVGSLSLLVIVTSSQRLPAIVLHKVPLWKKPEFAYSFSILVRSSYKSV